MTQRELYNHLCDVRSRIKKDSMAAEEYISQLWMSQRDDDGERYEKEIDHAVYMGDLHIRAWWMIHQPICDMYRAQWEEAIQLNKEI